MQCEQVSCGHSSSLGRLSSHREAHELCIFNKIVFKLRFMFWEMV